MIALIDGDLVAYRVAATCNSEEEGVLDIALLRVDKLMQDIVDATESSHYKCFLTGKNNFRYKVNPEYKANRKDIVRPLYLPECREYLQDTWNAETTYGYEADDALGVHQTEDTIICTLDKDLDMVPGRHYNWMYNNIYTVSELDGLRFLYKQLLIGDVSDNIKGVAKIGKVRAAKLIDHLITEDEMYKVVRDLYKDDTRLCMNMECLYIWH